MKCDEEIILLRHHCASLMQKQVSLNDQAYVKLNNFKTAATVIKDLNQNNQDLTKFIEESKDSFVGRPLLISKVLADWKCMKEMLQNSKEMLRKFGYLYDSDVLFQLQQSQNTVQKEWKNLKEMKCVYLSELPTAQKPLIFCSYQILYCMCINPYIHFRVFVQCAKLRTSNLFSVVAIHSAEFVCKGKYFVAHAVNQLKI